jgi:hypothetical protein
VGLSALAALSCGDATSPGASVHVVPDTVNLGLGEDLQLAVRVDGTERSRPAEGWFTGNSAIVAVEPDGVATGVGPGFTHIVAELGDRRAGVPAAVGMITYRNVDSVVVAQYASGRSRAPAIQLPAPAIALDNLATPSRWITTAYVGRDYYDFYLFPDGQILGGWGTSRLKPSGVQRVVVLIVDYGDTDIRAVMDQWTAAQDSVNGDHLALAAALGYEAPLVHFDNTNVMVASDSTGDPQNADSVYASLRRLGHDPRSYDIVASIPMTPQIRTGFASGLASFVSVGCHCPIPAQGERVHLTREMLDVMAAVVYHHEIGHLWGWRHEWGAGPEGTRIITKPVLFGWTDTDGDGVPEILDATPYGIAPGTLGLRAPGPVRPP